jgi:hypothetical protein
VPDDEQSRLVDGMRVQFSFPARRQLRRRLDEVGAFVSTYFD